MPNQWINRVVTFSRAAGRKRKSSKRFRRQLLLQGLESRKLLAFAAVLGMDLPHDLHSSAEIAASDGHASPNVMHNSNSTSATPHAGDPARAGEHSAALALVDHAAATHTVVSSGNWSDPTIWSNQTLPTDGAQIVIPELRTVTVDGVVLETFKTIRIDGTLRFDSSVDTELRVDTIVGSTTSTFEMGTIANPIDANVTARVVVADTGAIDRSWDPRALSRGVVLHGKTVINGAAKNGHSPVVTDPLAGDTSITLREAPSGWRVGDSLVIAGTNADATGDEVVKVASIDGSTVGLDRALQFNHLSPAADLQVHVANTTRNAVIESENTANDRRGHVMFMHTRDVQVAGAGFYELGRSNKTQTVNDVQLDANGALVTGTGTNPRGRYSVHFHRSGVKKDSAPATVTGSAVVASPGWGYVNHSSYVDFTDNVSYDVDGAAFNTEVGDEVGSFVDNLSIKTHGTGGEPVEDGDNQDYGRAGDGFWFHGSGIRVEGNVATGATGSGIIFWGETLVVGKDANGNPPAGITVAEYLVQNLPDPSLVPNHTSIPTLYVPLHQVSNNQAYGSHKGFEVYHHGDGELTEEQNARFGIGDGNLDVNPFNLPDSVVDGVTVWNSQTGVKLSYTENVRFSNVRVVNAFDQQGEIGFDAGTNMYNGSNQTYENLNIQGFQTGLLAARGETVVIDGGTFANAVDIDIPETRQTHRRMEIRGDIRFAALPSDAPANVVSTRQNIVMEADLRNIIDTNVTWFLLNDRVILNYGDFDGQQLYYADQTADNVLFTGQPAEVDPEDPGFDVPQQFIGLTNAELQTAYGTSFGGMLPSADAVDNAGDGIVGLLGSPTGDPALPVKPADIDVAVVDGASLPDEEEDENEPDDNEEFDEEDSDSECEDESDEEDDFDEEEESDDEDEVDETDEDEESDDWDEEEADSDDEEIDEHEGDEDETDEDDEQVGADLLTHEVTFNGETVSLQLAPFSNRGPNFSVLEQQSDGTFVSRYPGPVRTYIGTARGYSGAVATGLRRADGSVLASVTFEDGTEWVDDGTNVTSPELDEPVTPQLPEFTVRAGGAGSELYAAELGIDLPYDQVIASGGTTESALEMAEYSTMVMNALYARDAAITHKIERVIVRLDEAHDPYATSNELLDTVTEQWDNVLPPGNHDLALVASPRSDGAGVAYLAAVGGPGYSANGSTPNGNFSGVARHEVGHNWSIGHYDGGEPEGPTINSGNDLAKMSGPEIELVLSHRDDRISVLDNLGTPSTPLPPRASDDVAAAGNGGMIVVDAIANDHDVNGSPISIVRFDATTAGGLTVSQSGGRLIVDAGQGLRGNHDSFTYQIADGDGMTSTARVHLTSDPNAPATPDTEVAQPEEADDDRPHQNPMQPTDVNNDGVTTPLDALRVINHLSRSESGLVQEIAQVFRNYFDVDGNGSVSAIDALQIINWLSRSSAEGSLDVTPPTASPQVTSPRFANQVDSIFGDDDEELFDDRLFDDAVDSLV